MSFAIRLAEPGDIPALERLIPESVRGLQNGDYSVEQMEGSLGTVFGVDEQLIVDGTYFVIEAAGTVVACGGWSKRQTSFGTAHSPVRNNACLDPATEAARIRAFFVHPAWARRGIGSLLLRRSEEAASAAGFCALELVATLTGVPLYRAHGFVEMERFEVPLAGGAQLPVIRMSKQLRG